MPNVFGFLFEVVQAYARRERDFHEQKESQQDPKLLNSYNVIVKHQYDFKLIIIGNIFATYLDLIQVLMLILQFYNMRSQQRTSDIVMISKIHSSRRGCF
ncbi:hypothetical protein TNCT_261231 [Trichonephila clavata]|uniref:Uncharacterized protein n=1 Tax=Trichonephila clavata TaxID=2740835 RepID=A0A8X6GEF5_TRICU|nr:hypothetical protein TNCT_261231 [Trichonephila clavata]